MKAAYSKRTGLKKQRNKNQWTLPYAWAGRRYEVVITLWEDKKSIDYGKYMVFCGAALKVADTFEEAAELALEFTHGCALRAPPASPFE